MANRPRHHEEITNFHLHEHLLKMQEQMDKLGKDNSFIKTKLNKIMATVQEALDKVNELNTKVDELQAVVDTEQADIKSLVETNAQVVTDLSNQVVALQAIIDANPGIDAQPIIDAVNGVIAKVEAANADVSSTV